MEIKSLKKKPRTVELRTGLIPFKRSIKKVLYKHKLYIANTFFKECPGSLFSSNWSYTEFSDILPSIVFNQAIYSSPGNKVLFLVEKEEQILNGFKVETHIENVPGPFDPKIGIQQQVIVEKIELTRPEVKQFLFIYQGQVFRSTDSTLVNSLEPYGDKIEFKKEPIKVFGKFRTKIIKFFLEESIKRGFKIKK